MAKKHKSKRIIKCEGRFKELREYLHNDPLELVLGFRNKITEAHLKEMWELISYDIAGFDIKDPYFYNGKDHMNTDPERKEPKLDYLSLVPLFPAIFHFEDDLVQKYALSMGNRADITDFLKKMADKSTQFFHSVLNKDLGDLIVPETGGKNLAGYSVSANIGIGTATAGGVKGGGIRSDSPYLLDIYRTSRTTGESNLVAVVGFWAQDNSMLVSQMQSSKNASYPEGVPFGIASLYIAECAARKMGFDRVVSYSARSHPIFKEHPDNWKQFGKEFVAIWDNSARKLNFEATNGRNGHYIKDLTNNHSKK